MTILAGIPITNFLARQEFGITLQTEIKMKQAKDGFNTWTAPKMKVIIPSLETSVSELASAIEKRDLERVPEEMANGDF